MQANMSNPNGDAYHPSGMGEPLRKTDTIGSISLTPEQFDRLYLQPQNRVHGDLRRTFGNPTPVGLTGFLLAYTPLICEFLEWRGSGGQGLATIGTFYFLGGLLAIIASILEFILGNSFPSVFFAGYGGFFITYGATLQPFYGAYAGFSPSQSNPAEGQMEPAFLSSIAFLSVFMALFTTILMVAALRTNVIFVLAFLTLDLTFMFYAASRWYGAEGNMALFKYYQKVAGGVGFSTAIFGWYLLIAEILATVDFPVNLPVFDLSKVVPGAQDIARKKGKTPEEPKP